METKITSSHAARHYTAEEQFKDQIRLVRGFTMKNYRIGMHSQGFYEINIVLRGEAMHYIGKRAIKVKTGDTFIIPPDVMHAYDGGEGFDVYHILISPRYLEKNGAELQLLPAFSSLFRLDPMMRENTSNKLHFRLTDDEIGELSPKLAELTQRTYSNRTVDAVITNSEALVVIAWLCDVYEKHKKSKNEQETPDEAFMVSISYVYENYREKLTVDDLSKMARMSRTAYINKFKRVTGYPPARFVRRYRVEMAKRMLSGSSMSEAEIALGVGCTDTSHLVKLFMAEIGKSPSVFRNEVRGKKQTAAEEKSAI